jgi:hypothetical protein
VRAARRGLRKQYGKEGGLVRAVDGIDLDVAAGQTLAVMGPSGCGKSTLLHLLGGLDRPTAGELFFEDRRIDQLSERALAQLRRREIGFVFQSFQLLDELTARRTSNCLPHFPAGNASASLSREPWSTSRPSSSLTNRPGTLTAPPRWKFSGFSAPARRGVHPRGRHPRRAGRRDGGSVDLDAGRRLRPGHRDGQCRRA